MLQKLELMYCNNICCILFDGGPLLREHPPPALDLETDLITIRGARCGRGEGGGESHGQGRRRRSELWRRRRSEGDGGSESSLRCRKCYSYVERLISISSLTADQQTLSY